MLSQTLRECQCAVYFDGDDDLSFDPNGDGEDFETDDEDVPF